MTKDIYRFAFEPSVQMQDVDEALLLARLAVESLHGQSQVRMEASYCLDTEKRACVIDAATPVGRDICRIFTGFLIREFGETAFKVKRVIDLPAAPRPQEVTT
jgi:hypothetical protein